MSSTNWIDADIVCPFYIKSAKGFVQCEGIDKCSAIKLLFVSSKDGSPLKEDKKDFLKRYCLSEQGCQQCPVYKMLEAKYE